jgi:hypothetical protein
MVIGCMGDGEGGDWFSEWRTKSFIRTMKRESVGFPETSAPK